MSEQHNIILYFDIIMYDVCHMFQTLQQRLEFGVRNNIAPSHYTQTHT